MYGTTPSASLPATICSIYRFSEKRAKAPHGGRRRESVTTVLRELATLNGHITPELPRPLPGILQASTTLVISVVLSLPAGGA